MTTAKIISPDLIPYVLDTMKRREFTVLFHYQISPSRRTFSASSIAPASAATRSGAIAFI